MYRFFYFSLFLFASVVACSHATDQQNKIEKVAIAAVLDDFHQAASIADTDKYFGLLHKNAVFIGTDANERWDKQTFKQFAQPYFSQGKGWAYVPRDRHIDLSSFGNTAWFDELLDNEKYGECRGTGVLELTTSGWKIQQYHLTIPLPNALAAAFTEQIQQYKKGQ